MPPDRGRSRCVGGVPQDRRQANDLETSWRPAKRSFAAKGILMDQYGLKEQEAFRRIRCRA